MSKKRKSQHHHPSGNMPRIPLTGIGPQNAAALKAEINNAPMLNPPIIQSATEHGQILRVRKIGFLGSALFTGDEPAYLQTVNGEYYRLPADLYPWASDVVTMMLAMGGSQATGTFPARIEFGILNSRTYAEMLDDD